MCGLYSSIFILISCSVHLLKKTGTRFGTFCAAVLFLHRLVCVLFCSFSFATALSGEVCRRETNMLPHIIQICKCEWKCAGCIILLLCSCLSVQIENIDACLSFLAAKGVNIQGLSAEGKLDFFYWSQSSRHKTRLSQPNKKH